MVQQCFLSLKSSKKLFSTVNSFNDKCKSCCENRKIICFIYFKCNEDMNDIIKIRKSLEDSSVLIDGVTGTVKDEIKKTRRHISWSFVSTFIHFICASNNFFRSERYKRRRR